MDTELVYAMLVIAFGLGALVYKWYLRVTAPDSEEGEKITLGEVFDLLDDPDFRNLVEEMLEILKKKEKIEGSLDGPLEPDDD